jgi:DNA polymerase-3 subunit epsilon
MAWACSCREIDWAARGFDGKGLGWLLSQAGQFHEGHRAADDVDALIAMLRHRDQDGITALAELIANAGTPGWIVRAIGAAFEVKDRLKARGYRWDAAARVWMREVRDCDRMAEEFWLAAHVYDPGARPRALGPTFEETDWYRRHGAL